MATPLSADRLLAALRAEGVRVVEHRSWRSNNRNAKGPWGPVHGVMIHHTVTSGTDASVRLCYDGHSALPGPLCHGVIAKDGTVYLVGNGRANHAGLGDGDVLAAVIAERALPADNEADTDGNARFYGFEAVNLGDGRDPWPAAQVEAVVRASAAILRAHGWGKAGDTSVIGHSEWQPGKVDPRGPGITMRDVRRRVAERLKHPADWSPGDTNPPNERPKEAPMHLYYERRNPVTLTPGDWYTITWDRVWAPEKGWSDRDLAQTLLKGEHTFSLDFAIRAEGLARGQEIQLRVARNHRRPGQEWARAKSWPISSPVHDGGRLHAAHHWQGHLPGSDDNRLVAEVLATGSAPIQIDELTASLLAWPA
ncbi:peptidoglycan recognition family protein [Streptomyces sp. DSM 44915]|uniref:Peptidoglycan recognition family protein n=1 Tax=Streptomyces chisholmiae TaxID=3075540 RepID=A0ABU2K1D2_9ACTN|nr:peptidoglycan recognition family protein [Streptomyces sp. DSM 44915]MDT0270248.1 peptidoglycan recognition family protein [Streptomyces sp. DSM 44915]